jgi:hypothetical protein
VVQTAEPAVFDLYLLNDTNQAIKGELALMLEGPDLTATQIASVPAPEFESDRLSYLLQSEVTTAPLNRAGTWKSRFSLNSSPEMTHECVILAVDPAPAGMKPLRVATAQVAPIVENHCG